MEKIYLEKQILDLFDSYHAYNQEGKLCYEFKGEFSLGGHSISVYDKEHHHIGTINETGLGFTMQCDIYIHHRLIGTVTKRFLSSNFEFKTKGWIVEGDILGWNFVIKDKKNQIIMKVKKLHEYMISDYLLEITHTEDVLLCIMIISAISLLYCTHQIKVNGVKLR